MKKTLQFKKSLLLCALGSPVLLVGCNSGSTSSATTPTTPTYIYTTGNSSNSSLSSNIYIYGFKDGGLERIASMSSPELVIPSKSSINDKEVVELTAEGLTIEAPVASTSSSKIWYMGRGRQDSNSTAAVYLYSAPTYGASILGSTNTTSEWTQEGICPSFPEYDGSKGAVFAVGYIDTPVVVAADDLDQELLLCKPGTTADAAIVDRVAYADIGLENGTTWGLRAIDVMASSKDNTTSLQIAAATTNTQTVGYKVNNIDVKFDGGSFALNGDPASIFDAVDTPNDAVCTSHATATQGVKVTTLNNVSGGRLDNIQVEKSGAQARVPALTPTNVLFDEWGYTTGEEFTLNTYSSYLDKFDAYERKNLMLGFKSDNTLAAATWTDDQGADVKSVDLLGTIGTIQR